MKKLLFTFLLTVMTLFTVSAQNSISLKGISYSQKQLYQTYNGGTRWSDWSPWTNCSVLIKINLVTDKITIYSNTPQYYDIFRVDDAYYDNDGDKVMKMYAVDADDDRCTLRLVYRRNGDAQLYVDFANIMWVYNVIKI